MSQPLVSVAMATRNGAAHLRAQLDSVYAQTWPQLEVVVSDDASSDDTPALLEMYRQRHGLRYEVNPEPLGLVRNFERVLSLCRGEYIALCDQDDLWKPHKLATLIERLGAATLIYATPREYLAEDGVVRIDHRNEPWMRFARTRGVGKPTCFLLAENWVVSHTVLFRRALLEHALPFPPGQPFHDGWLALVASTLDGLAYCEEALQIYRHHTASLTHVPLDAPPRRGLAARLRSGELAHDWRRRCEAETRRIEGALSRARLSPEEDACAEDLLAYYRSGLGRGRLRRAVAAGWRVAPRFGSVANARRQLPARARFALRALAGGLPA